MNTSKLIRRALNAELQKRGFTTDLEAPNGTIGLTESYSTTTDLADLLDLMVTRREKIFRSVEVVGPDAAKKSYNDVLLVIEAVKAVIARLSLPRKTSAS